MKIESNKVELSQILKGLDLLIHEKMSLLPCPNGIHNQTDLTERIKEMNDVKQLMNLHDRLSKIK